MFKRNLVTVIASMATGMLATWSAANATVYAFTFNSPSESIIGQLTVDASNNQITNITGTLSGLVNDSIDGFIANASFPNSVSLPDGAFVYDNVFYPGQDQLVDQYGVVFTTAGNPGGYWNLWSSAPGDYSLYEFEPERRLSNWNRRRNHGSGSNRGSGAFDLGDDADWPGGSWFGGLPAGPEGPSRPDIDITFRRFDARRGARGAFSSFRGLA